VKRLASALFLLSTLLLSLPGQALGATTPEEDEEEFNPEHEFELDAWVPLELGPIDMSINKAVVYLWIGGLVTMALGIGLMRVRLKVDPDTRQTVGETIYEITQTQIAEQGLPSKAIGLWFPYVATLFLFIWSLNMVGFLPLPISNEKFHVGGFGIPTWGIYAATAQISVTLTLAIFSVLFTHVEGFRHNGAKYLKSFVPSGVPKGMVPVMAVLEFFSHAFRVVSLSVRLYANMLAGHMLILVMIGLVFIVSGFAAIITIPFAAAFYLFEVGIVVSIQAFIFAALTAIYIGSAIEPEH
jgi:F-type H+-transporting ATPase subunit a